MTRQQNDAALAAMYQRLDLPRFAEAFQPELPKCPKCGAEDSMEHVKTEYHNIETHYDECVVCGHGTAPE
jgi:hypothetical protein